MKLSLGSKSHVVKIASVDMRTFNTGCELHIDTELYVDAAQTHLLPTICAQNSLFAVVCTDAGHTVGFLKSPGQLAAYIEKKKFNPNVYVATSALASKLSALSTANYKGGVNGYKFTIDLTIATPKSAGGGNDALATGGWQPNQTQQKAPSAGPDGVPANMFLFVGLVGYSSALTGVQGAPGAVISIDTLNINTPESPASFRNLILYEDNDLTKIYLGDAAQTKSGQWFKKGQRPRPESFLYEKPAQNFKLKNGQELIKLFDKQIIDSTPKKITSDNISNASMGDIIQAYRNDHKNYFSSLYGSKTNHGKFPFVFAFNASQFFKDRGAMGNILKNKGIMGSSFTLLSARILRRRKTSKYVSNKLTAYAPSLNTGPEELVSEALQILDMSTGQPYMLLTGLDPAVGELTVGIYDYGVELAFIDYSREKVKKLLTSPQIGLLDLSARLEEFQAELEKPWNYSGTSGALTEGYEKSLNNKKEEDKIWLTAIDAYLGVVTHLCSSIKQVYGIDLKTLAKKLYVLTNPFDNGPAGIIRLQALVDDMITQIRNIFPTTERYTKILDGPEKAGTNYSKMHTQGNIIRIKHYFDEHVESEVYGDFGYSYLPEGRNGPSYSPMRVVNATDVLTVLKKQQQNFNKENPIALGAYPVTLSPSSCRLSDVTYTFDSALPFPAISTAATTLVLGNRSRLVNKNFAPSTVYTQNQEGPSATELKSLINNLKLLRLNGCNIKVETESPGTLFAQAAVPSKALQPTTADYEDAAAKMSEESPFIINKPPTTSLIDFIADLQNHDHDLDYLRTLELMSSDMLYYLTQADYFVKTDGNLLPVKNITDENVFKSKESSLESFTDKVATIAKTGTTPAKELLKQKLLAHGSTESMVATQYIDYVNALKASTNARDIVEFSLKYGALRQVEYFNGFGSDSYGISLGAPVWVKMSRQYLESFARAPTPLLCRLRSPSCEFSEYYGVQSPIYDEFFVLGGAGTDIPKKPYLRGVQAISVKTINVSKELEAGAHSFRSTNKYIFSTVAGVDVDHEINIKGDQRNGSVFLNNLSKALYTGGSDYTQSGGASDFYIGEYHINIDSSGKATAMVGPKHTGNPHPKLQPVSQKATNQLKRAEAYWTRQQALDPADRLADDALNQLDAEAASAQMSTSPAATRRLTRTSAAAASSSPFSVTRGSGGSGTGGGGMGGSY